MNFQTATKTFNDIKTKLSAYEMEYMALVEEAIAKSQYVDSISVNSAGRSYAKVNVYIEGQLYKAGEFVPEDTLGIKPVWFDEVSTRHGSKKKRVKLIISPEVEEVVEMLNMNHVLQCSFGARWESGDYMVAYLWCDFPSNTTSMIFKILEEAYGYDTHKDSIQEPQKDLNLELGRYEFNVKLIKYNIVPCYYNGARAIGVFKTDNGAIIVGNPSNFADDRDVGKTFRIKATVDGNKDQGFKFKRPVLVQ